MKINFLPYPIASVVLWRGEKLIIVDVSDLGEYILHGHEDFNNEQTQTHWVPHHEVWMLFPPSTSCDWNRMLEAKD